jgi:ComEC/Rec2-related protein
MKFARVTLYCLALIGLGLRLLLSEAGTAVITRNSRIELTGAVERVRVSEDRQTIVVGGQTVWAPIYPRLTPRDSVWVKGVIECFGDKAVCSYGTVKAETVKLIEPGLQPLSLTSVFGYFSKVHDEATKVYYSLLPKNQAELLSGIVFGGSSLSPSYKSKLADVGLSHVVAASGMNVTFFASLAFSFISVFQARKIIIVIFGCTLVWLYCGIAGFEASVVRAGLMVTLTLFAQALGRHPSSWWGLGLAGYIMLWVNPELIRDFGFLLSFSSMMGQISVSNLSIRLRMVWKFLAQSFVQNVAAILATLPMMILLFGRLSLVTIITNMLVVWTVEPLMIFGLAAVILGFITYQMAEIVLLPAGILLIYFNTVVDYFEAIPWAVFRVDNPGWLFLIGFYMFLGGTLMWFKMDQGKDRAV